MSLKTSVTLSLILSVVGTAGADSCGAKQARQPQNTNRTGQGKEVQVQIPQPVATRPGAGEREGGMKTLAQGSYGGVELPFLVVARDADVYGALRRIVKELPEVGSDFFKANAVVAAFLGSRNTGGYAVRITRAGGQVFVEQESPPPGNMVTQAFTQPYQVVSVPVGEEGIELVPRGMWAEPGLRPYRVTSGEFQTGGGIAGRVEKVALEGNLSVAQHDSLATVLFDLRVAGTKQARALKGAATALVRDGGSFSASPVDAGTLVERPRSPLRVAGRLTANGDRLSLTFESLPARVADGFSGQGRLEAVATAPAPKRGETIRDR